MRGLGCGWAATAEADQPDLVFSGISNAPEAAEDLAADGVIPIAEGIANRSWAGGPRAAPKNLVLTSEECLGVLRVREALEIGVRLEITRGPLPDVTNHPGAPDRRNVRRITADRGGAETQLIHVGQLPASRRFSPGVAALAALGGIPGRRCLPLELGRQPLSSVPRERLGFVVAHVTDGVQGVDRSSTVHRTAAPYSINSIPVFRCGSA